MGRSDKSRTNHKWVSTDAYKEAHERIFGKKQDEKKDESTELVDPPIKNEEEGEA